MWEWMECTEEKTEGEGGGTQIRANRFYFVHLKISGII
jgi:hypothetical protein